VEGRRQVWVEGRRQVWVVGRRQVWVVGRRQVWVGGCRQVWVVDRRVVWEVDRTRVWAVHILASVFLTNHKNVIHLKIKRTGTYLVGHKLVLEVWAVHMSWKGEGHITRLEDHKMISVVLNFRHH
jgi:hypothetical protein